MMRSLIFEVVGDQRLHCESCELRVKRLLKGVPGVNAVKANSRDQRIEVLFDPTVLNAAAIAERLRTAGYETAERDV